MHPWRRTPIRVGALTALALALPFSTVSASGAAASATIGRVGTGSYTFNFPWSALRDGKTMYVSDRSHARVVRFTLNDAGTAATAEPEVVAGTGGECVAEDQPACGDGGVATSARLVPATMALTTNGLLILDAGTNRLRRVYTKGPKAGTIEAFAGNGTAGYAGDGGNAKDAQIGTVVGGIAVGPDKNVYFADTLNNRIRCVGCAGRNKISTVVGTGKAAGHGQGEVTTGSPDGTPALQANLLGPWGVAFDAQGRLLFTTGCDVAAVLVPMQSGHPEQAADYCDPTVRRRNNNANQTITRIAGIPGQLGVVTSTGPARQRRLNNPLGLGVRGDRIYVSTLGSSFLTWMTIFTNPDFTLADLVAMSPGILCIGCAGNGKISRVAGERPANGAIGNGGPAADAATFTYSLQPQFTGDLYYADPIPSANQVRRIRIRN
ncbi:MAG: hypothetical protein ACOYNI_02445 [Acidimicrobiia bacterium]